MSKQVKNIEHDSEFRQVLVSDLAIDPEAQRVVSVPWVKARIQKFDADQLGYIVVNKRSNGKMFIIDGQHRVELLRAVGWGDQGIHAEYFEGLTQAEEASLFISRNDRKAVRPIDKFRIAVTAKDPVACDISRIVNEHKLIISDQVETGRIVAVAALKKIYDGGGIVSKNDGPVALANTLKIILLAWGNQASSLNGKIIQGIGLVQLRYNGKLEQKTLTEKLAPFPGGAPGIIGKARAMREMRGRPMDHCVASIVVDIYNKGRRTGKLDEWES